MSKILNDQMFAQIAAAHLEPANGDFTMYLRVIDPERGLIEADSDFVAGLGLGLALDPALCDLVELTYLAKVGPSKMYRLSIEGHDTVIAQVEDDYREPAAV